MEDRSEGQRGHHAGHTGPSFLRPSHSGLDDTIPQDQPSWCPMFGSVTRQMELLVLPLLPPSRVALSQVSEPVSPSVLQESAAVLSTRRRDLPTVAKVPEWEAAGGTGLSSVVLVDIPWGAGERDWSKCLKTKFNWE